jgi:glycosyltransferase involved in cell wall biosynthesis
VPTLSLCAIVRDEETHLPRMLRSIQCLVDEIVICDTGSRDRTVAIAREHGAKVVFHEFADDFSAPRNTALAAASSDWVLVLDADEWLADGAAEAIRRAIENSRVVGYYLRFENHLSGGRVHRCGLMRLFRRDPSIRFEFCFHEQVIPALIRFARAHDLKLAPLDSAVVHHDGYLEERVAETNKNARNLRLFERQVREHPRHAYSWYKFGDFLRRFPERRADATAALERARELVLELDLRDAKDLSFGPEVFALLALEADRAGKPERALELLNEGRRIGETPNLLHVLGHVHARRNDHRASLAAYARLRLADRRLHAIPPEPGITGPYACFAMGRALANLGHPRAARRCLDESVKLDPRRRDPRLLRARLLLDTGDVAGALEDYRVALEEKPGDHATRVRSGVLLFQRGDFTAAARELARALDDGAPPRGVAGRLGIAQLATGRFEAALDAFALDPADADCSYGLALLENLAGGSPVKLGPPPSTAWRRVLAPESINPAAPVRAAAPRA